MNWIGIVVFAVVTFLVGPIPSPDPGVTRSPTPTPMFPTITILSVGDSLTYGTDGSVSASYRIEFSRLMTKTGQPHQFIVQGVPGSKCSYWTSRIDGLITMYHPDIILLACGVNDTPTDNTEADYRTILATAQARNVRLVAALIGRPDMDSNTNKVRPWIDTWMVSTNDAIERALVSYPSVPVARMWRVPADIEWLQPDGIHLTKRSEDAYARLFYPAAQTIMTGWKTLSQMGITEPCGLYGRRRPGDPWPVPDVAYRVCRS